jgi:hypothetical protein
MTGIVLKDTTESLVFTLGGSNSHAYTANFAKITPGGRAADAIASSTTGVIATTAETALVAAPAAGFTHVCTSFFVRNDTAITTTVQVAKDISGTNRNISPLVSLTSGQSLFWSEETGFKIYLIDGGEKAAA